MQIEEVMGGNECRHSETGVLPVFRKLERQTSDTLIERAMREYRKQRYGNVLALLRAVPTRDRSFRRYRRLHQLVMERLGRSAQQ